MTSDELKERFRLFAIQSAMIIKSIPKDTINSAFSNQLIRSSSAQPEQTTGPPA